MKIHTSIFKDYDIRGVYHDEINGSVARQVGYAIMHTFHPKTIAICRDMRLSGKELFDGLSQAFISCGCSVYDAGLTGTEQAYFISGTYTYDMTIMISASHNPAPYNGLKIVLRCPIAISGDTGLYDIKSALNLSPPKNTWNVGHKEEINVYNDWKEKIYSLIDVSAVKPLHVIADAGNGMGGKLISYMSSEIPVKLTSLNFEPDGNFPNHVPNPLIPSNNIELIKTVIRTKADIGLAFDGDADRVFFIDDTGRFVSGTLVTALLAKYMLEKHPGNYVLYSAVCGRIVPQIITKYGGRPVRVSVGHSFMKNYMKKYNAIFAGEHSGHYYYHDYFNSESGILTSLIMLTLISKENKKLSEMLREVDVYPSSGEINFKINDISLTMSSIRKQFHNADSIDDLDGLSIWYKDYWINIRASKTEPLLRLNIEADTQEILEDKTTSIIHYLEKMGGILQ